MKNFTGLTIHQYHIMQQLGHGGMAAVYKAYDTRFDRDVAIKLIRVEEVPSEFLPQVNARFQKEAELQTQFKHPNIVPVYDFGDFEDIPYLVLEYLPGGTLKQRMHRPLSLRSAVRILAPVADALVYAHSLGVIHRDIKPSNILFNSQRMPLLSDFGTAKILEPGKDEPGGLGVGIGTPAYMAPEQWRGLTVPQTDIYALGVVMFEILTGIRPYTADTPIAVALKQAGEPIPNPRYFVSGLHEQVEHFLYRAMAKDINNRFGSMAEMRVALESLAQLQPPEEQKVATIVYETQEPPSLPFRVMAPQVSQPTPGLKTNDQDLFEHSQIDLDIPGAAEPEDLIDESPGEAPNHILSYAQKPDGHEEQIPRSTIVESLYPLQIDKGDQHELIEEAPRSQAKDKRKIPRTKPHARPIPITDSRSALPVQKPTEVKANKKSTENRLSWSHVLILALAWGFAHLIKGLIVTWLSEPTGFELATALGTTLAWLLGGLAISLVFQKAINLDSTRVAVIPPTIGFISGLSMLIGFIIGSEWGWVFSSALLWGLVGLVMALAFKPKWKQSDNTTIYMAIGWALGGGLSAITHVIKLDSSLITLVGKEMGYLIFGLVKGFLLGSCLGLAAGFAFVKSLKKEWHQVLVLSLFWSLGLGLGHAVYEFMVNGIQNNFIIASGLSWAIQAFFVFLGIKLAFQKINLKSTSSS